MSDERRYDDAEVAEILERATAAEARAPRPPSAPIGLTLAELQEIGAEVGIAPDRITEAARTLGQPVSASPRSFLGAARSVYRVVPIPRALDDEEWTRLVVILRETFGAEGRIRIHGTLRTWSNGNLQVHVEPDGDQYRVRMQTLKGDVLPRVGFAAVTVGMSGVMFFVNATSGLRPGGVVVAAAMALAGLGQLGYIRALLPRWASERAAQMEGLAERIPSLLRK